MKIGRNDPCHCGSGKKYKHCCARKQDQREQIRDSVGRGMLYLLAPLALAVLAAVAISALRTPDTSEGPQKVWSAAHNHWHYRLPDGSEVEARPGLVWSPEEGRFVQGTPITDAARRHVRSRLADELAEVEEKIAP